MKLKSAKLANLAKLATTLLASALFISTASLGQNSPGAQPGTPGAAEPVLVVDAGPCTADFVVRDESGKSIYDAKITLKMQYGFMGFHRLDLNVGTSADGKARIEGLPDRPRKDVDFKVAQGGREKFVAYDPVGHCMAQHDVTLEGSAASKAN